MKKYQVKFNEIKATVFEVEANNKIEAKEKVEEVINKICDLNIIQVYSTLSYAFDVNKIQKDK